MCIWLSKKWALTWRTWHSNFQWLLVLAMYDWSSCLLTSVFRVPQKKVCSEFFSERSFLVLYSPAFCCYTYKCHKTKRVTSPSLCTVLIYLYQMRSFSFSISLSLSKKWQVHCSDTVCTLLIKGENDPLVLLDAMSASACDSWTMWNSVITLYRWNSYKLLLILHKKVLSACICDLMFSVIFTRNELWC